MIPACDIGTQKVVTATELASNGRFTATKPGNTCNNTLQITLPEQRITALYALVAKVRNCASAPVQQHIMQAVTDNE